MWQAAYSREDLFNVLTVAHEASSSMDIGAEDKRYMEKTLQHFKSNGLGAGTGQTALPRCPPNHHHHAPVLSRRTH
jgi:hypothetical protein